MSAIFADNFELYGESETRLKQGVYADTGQGSIGNVGIAVPSWELDGRPWLLLNSRADALRYVMPTDETSIGCFIRFRCDELPADRNYTPIGFLDSGGDVVLELVVDSIGQIFIVNSAGDTVATSSSAPIAAGVVYAIHMQATMGALDGTVEVRVDGTEVINESSLVLAGTIRQWRPRQDTGAAGVYKSFWIKCVALYDLSGTYNDDWPKISDVITLMIDEDTADSGFTPRRFEKFGAGVALFPETGSNAIYIGDSADYDLGTGSYTLEAWVRFTSLPEDPKYATIFARWARIDDQRSFFLYWKPSGASDGLLKFDVTTDGTATTITNIHNVSWVPQLDRWYHIAVCRETTNNRLFIDGVMQGAAASDSNDYFNTDVTGAEATLGAHQNDPPGKTTVGDGTFRGRLDEVRFTKGVARYVADFSPPQTKFGRDVADDPDFASVVFLAGFDDALKDESASPKTVVGWNDAQREQPGDGPEDFKVANTLDPLDGNFLEGALVPATGVLSLTDVPLADETVTLGTQTYTFKTVFSISPTANEVLIGSDIVESLDNLQAAINNDAGSGVKYSSLTLVNSDAFATAGAPTLNDMRVTAKVPGTAGNSIATTETLTEGSWDDTTMSGGSNLPGPSRFGVEPLPDAVTGVRWLHIRSRVKVFDGDADMVARLEVSGDSDAGASRTISAGEYAYYDDLFEEDPSTSSAMTPSTITNGSIEIERTA